MEFEGYLNLARKYNSNKLRTSKEEARRLINKRELYLVYDSHVSAVLDSIDGVKQWIRKRIPEKDSIELVEKIYREDGILLIPKFDILKISISGYEPIDLEQILENENETR